MVSLSLSIMHVYNNDIMCVSVCVYVYIQTLLKQMVWDHQSIGHGIKCMTRKIPTQL